MGILRAIPLGGSGEIGKNCTVIETEDDIIIIDCGISFPHEEHHGVDIVIPDFDYILQNKDKVRGIVVTHAHEDHVGALSFLLPQLSVPLYATPLTEAMVRSKLEERIKLVDVQIEPMTPGKKFKIGGITVEPIRVTHSIPETCAIALHTEHGIVLFTADFKFDAAPVDHITTDVKRLAELGEEGVVLLLCDSTNIERPGWSPSESEVESSFREIFQKAEGRVLVTQFSSNIHRMQQIINAAKATGRKVSVAGRRMDMTFQMVRNMGYLNVDKQTYIPIDEVSRYAPEDVAIMVTGSQGEQMAALSQMSRGEYSRLQVKHGDTIVYSARPIPGNEAGIWRTVNNLVRRGAKVITDYHSHIHVSGHGYIDEIKEMLALTKPFYVAPVHGEPRHQRLFEDMLLENGHQSHRIFVMENGDQLCMNDERAYLDTPVKWGQKLIDQRGNKEVSEDILRERITLANEGMFAISVVVDRDAGSLLTRPRADVSGFLADEPTVEDILDSLCRSIERLSPAELSNLEFFEKTLKEETKRIVWRKTNQKPMIVVILEGV